jgi:hypothetical protein
MTSTILYYTSNREKPELEERVKQNILKVSNLPIVSVSQKPIDFGKNICVGDVGTSGFNMFRQVLIGCQATDSDYIISAEADCLYPPDYFTYIPPRDDRAYRDSNLYVMPDQRAFFFYKEEGATHAQVVNRKYYIQVLEELFKDAPMWCVEEKNFPRERHHMVDVFKGNEYFRTENPVVQIKTHMGMRYYTHSDRTPINDIPYWGNGKAFRDKYYHGKD